MGAEPRGAGEAFDLNIERVLKDWTVAHAVREVIANALDEQILTNTAAVASRFWWKSGGAGSTGGYYAAAVTAWSTTSSSSRDGW